MLRNLATLKDDTEEDLVDQTSIRMLSAWRATAWCWPARSGVAMARQCPADGPDGQKLGRNAIGDPAPTCLSIPPRGRSRAGSFDARTEGVPPLVIEVASPETYRYDMAGKRDGYFVAGVEEYLLFDPTGDLLGTQIQAWRRQEEAFVPWTGAVDGRWHSGVIPVSFRPEGLLLRVHDAIGVHAADDHGAGQADSRAGTSDSGAGGRAARARPAGRRVKRPLKTTPHPPTPATWILPPRAPSRLGQPVEPGW